MRTVFVSGSDTGVGKTRVVSAVAGRLLKNGRRIQIIKPIESGVTDATSSDMAEALRLSGADRTDTYVFRSFGAPLAPVTAARLAGETLSLPELVGATSELPTTDWRIVEGAGGLATPIDEAGRDWADFALALKADFTVLVVSDRLGAIGQARLVDAYAKSRGIRVCGVVLCETTPVESDVSQSNFEGVQASPCQFWGRVSYDTVSLSTEDWKRWPLINESFAQAETA